MKDGQHFPRRYTCDNCDLNEFKQLLEEMEHRHEDDLAEGASDAACALPGVVPYTPPVATSLDAYHIMKFYALDDKIIRKWLSEAEGSPSLRSVDGVLDCPFIPDEVSACVCVCVCLRAWNAYLLRQCGHSCGSMLCACVNVCVL
jgi:hypothetical protein